MPYINFDTDPIPVVCDGTYDVNTEIFKFIAQFVYILPGIVLNLLVLKTVWLKHSKVYMENSFFVIFSVDCVVNTLILLTEGLMARPLLYIPPICPLIADYFDMPFLPLKIIAILVFHAKICKSIIQALLVLYRMTCVLLPMRHALIWSKNTMKILVPLILLIPISVDWNIAISRVYVQGAYGGLWISYIKKISWASQSRFQLGFILAAMAITISGTLATLVTLMKLPERAKNLERAISNATIILSIGFTGTAVFQIYFGFFLVRASTSDPFFGLNFLSWDFLTVGSPIVMLCVSPSLREHVLGQKSDNDSVFQRSRTI